MFEQVFDLSRGNHIKYFLDFVLGMRVDHKWDRRYDMTQLTKQDRGMYSLIDNPKV